MVFFLAGYICMEEPSQIPVWLRSGRMCVLVAGSLRQTAARSSLGWEGVFCIYLYVLRAKTFIRVCSQVTANFGVPQSHNVILSGKQFWKCEMSTLCRPESASVEELLSPGGWYSMPRQFDTRILCYMRPWCLIFCISPKSATSQHLIKYK